MKVYLVLDEWVDELGGDGFTIEAFDSLEKAQKFFECAKKSLLGDILATDVVEETSTSFQYYEEGNYCLNHRSLTLKENTVY